MPGELTHLHVERAQPAVRRLRVQVLDGPDKDRVVEHAGCSLAVGSSPDNELTLSDPTVSCYHLELLCEEGVLVKDLGSRNGTFIGDVRIHEALVPVGARVKLGRTVLALLDVGIEANPSPVQAPEIPGLVAASPSMH